MLLVYSPQTTPRLHYIFKLIFSDILSVDFRITNAIEEFKKFEGVKLNYSEHPIGDELFFYATHFLFEKGITDQQITLFEWEGTKVFYATHPKYIFPFDPFAASFFLVSRYEEYLPHIQDKHERFVPTQSLAYQKNFLQKPLINIWAQKIKEKIKEKYPQFSFPEKHYKYISSIDIDSAYAYCEKGFTRTLASFAKSLLTLNFNEVIEKAKVLTGIQKDPYDTYDIQLALQKKYNLHQIYFFLVGDYDIYDKNIPIDSKRFRALIKFIADYSQVGIHFSYASNENTDKLKKDFSRLSKVLKREVNKSRQHFLKLTLPLTYRNLLDAGITEDYTMGYASEIGFRASICTPFYFYDLDMEMESKLKIFPFALMDGTLREYMKLSANEAIERAKQLVDEVKKVNGLFITLWHNHTLNDSKEWQGWLRVYEEIVKYAC